MGMEMETERHEEREEREERKNTTYKRQEERM